MFSFYYDYDFRNWQALELLEDSFWESIYSIYTHDEYMNLSKDFSDFEYFDKFSKSFVNIKKNFNLVHEYHYVPVNSNLQFFNYIK